MELAALDLVSMGPEAVVVKGGHLEEGPCDDCLCIGRSDPKIFWFSTPRIETKNTHGTGCTFSSAIASYLAKGLDITSAVEKSKEYMNGCIEAGSRYQLGHGHGPVHHFHSLLELKKKRYIGTAALGSSCKSKVADRRKNFRIPI